MRAGDRPIPGQPVDPHRRVLPGTGRGLQRRAGFDAIGLGLAQHREHKAEGMVRGRWSRPRRQRHQLTEIEVRRFAVGGRAGGRSATCSMRRPRTSLSSEMATTLVFVTCRPSACSTVRWSRRRRTLAGLCDRAAEHGLLVALEFVPESSVPTPRRRPGSSVTPTVQTAAFASDARHHFRGATMRRCCVNCPPIRSSCCNSVTGSMVPEDDDFNDTLHNAGCRGRASRPAGASSGRSAMGVSAPASFEVISDELTYWCLRRAKALGGCLEHYRIDRVRPEPDCARDLSNIVVGSGIQNRQQDVPEGTLSWGPGVTGQTVVNRQAVLAAP